MSAQTDPLAAPRSLAPSTRVCFDFHGLRLIVESASPGLVEEVRRDFAYFHRPGAEDGGHFRIELHLTEPRYRGLPSVPAAFFTPRNVCFRDGGLTYIDYYGQALAIFDRQAGRCVVHGLDHDLVHEIAYLFVLSTVGQHLDRLRLHRLHALAVSYHGRGILLALPSGGGKSTMALQLLREPDFLLLAEDTPLIDRQGGIVPFPLRVGVRHEQKTDVPPQFVRTVKRMEFDPKTLIDIEYFRDRLGGPAAPGMFLVGERNLGDVSAIVPISRRAAWKALTKYMIVGLGIYQGMEFLLERGVSEILGQGGVAVSRLYNGLRLLARTPAYRFILGRDPRRNYETLLDFVRRTDDAAR